jgi:Holliday junction resolvasome RuvABC endonuclease subunit
MSNIIRVIGMDPSLSNWGIAYAALDMQTLEFKVDDLELIQTEPEKDKKLKKVVRKNSEDLERAILLQRGMAKACERAVIAFAEVPVGSQSSRAMASYGVCVGVLAACSIPLVQVTPNEVKIAACGSRTATKHEMIEWAVTHQASAPWLRRSGRMVDKNEHLADAVAAIKAGIETDDFQRLVAVLLPRLSVVGR